MSPHAMLPWDPGCASSCWVRTPVDKHRALEGKPCKATHNVLGDKANAKKANSKSCKAVNASRATAGANFKELGRLCVCSASV